MIQAFFLNGWDTQSNELQRLNARYNISKDEFIDYDELMMNLHLF